MAGITIYDVAKEANVSPSTVSNVLNGRTERMQTATRVRVEATIRRLKYSPNRAARQLRSGGIHTLGLVVPSVSNPFWGMLANYFERAALRKGYGVLLCNSGRDVERERTYLEELLNDGVTGVVLGSSLPSMRHLGPLIKRGLRPVTLDRSSQPSDPKGMVDISVDNAAGAGLVADKLWEQGHRRIAFVSGSTTSINRQERVEGFLSALEAHGMDRDQVVVWRDEENSNGGSNLTEVGRHAAHSLLTGTRPHVTAIATVNDMCAMGVYRGVRDAGLHVGLDVAVAGFDDIPFAELIQPTLTTVHQPLAQMADIALERLLAMMEDPTQGPGESMRLEPRLIERESTATLHPHDPTTP